jgi:hypothetical protein
MERSQFSPTLVLSLAWVLYAGSAVAQPLGKTSAALSASFAAELNRIGDGEIVQNPGYCTSKTRPLRVSQELSSILSRALKESEQVRVRSECSRIAGEQHLRFCRMYFFSPIKTVQWTMGLTFVADARSGEIDAQSIECFSTP